MAPGAAAAVVRALLVLTRSLAWAGGQRLSPRLPGSRGVTAEPCCAPQAMALSAQGLGPLGECSGLGPQRLGHLQLLLGPVGGQGGQEAAAVAMDAKHGSEAHRCSRLAWSAPARRRDSTAGGKRRHSCSDQPIHSAAAPRRAPAGSPLGKGYARRRVLSWRDRPGVSAGAHCALAVVAAPCLAGRPCGVPSLRRLASAVMVPSHSPHCSGNPGAESLPRPRTSQPGRLAHSLTRLPNCPGKFW